MTGERGAVAPEPRERVTMLLGWLGAALLVAGIRLAPPAPAAAPPMAAPPAAVPPAAVTPAPPPAAAPPARPASNDTVAAPPRPAAPRPAGSRTDRPRADRPRPFTRLRAFSSPLLAPRLAFERVLGVDFPALRGLTARAQPGQAVEVRLTAYCLRGLTRSDTPVRPGVVAADPRVFPLARQVELFAAGRYLGRFHVEDTGSGVRGAHIDIWTPDCKDARRFGSRTGVATLVGRGER